MASYNLPPLPPRYRWYLSRTSAKYADLRVQHKTWWGGWKTLTFETLNTNGKYHPFDICLKEAAEDCLRTLEAPKPEYGVVT